LPRISRRRAIALANELTERREATALTTRVDSPPDTRLAILVEDPRPDKRFATALTRVVLLNLAAIALASLLSEIRRELVPRRAAIALTSLVSDKRSVFLRERREAIALAIRTSELRRGTRLLVNGVLSRNATALTIVDISLRLAIGTTPLK
jgi:hypothetical protein